VLFLKFVYFQLIDLPAVLAMIPKQIGGAAKRIATNPAQKDIICACFAWRQAKTR